jgi:PAS domain S-box-containing protein
MLTTLDLSTIKLFGPHTATLLSLENGKIKWASKNAHTLFDYSREEFHSLTINQLMPRYFADRHDSYIKKWKETGHHIKLNNTSYLWGSSKDGHCFSLLMFAKVILLHGDQDYAFFACLEKMDS